MDTRAFASLTGFLEKIPSVITPIQTGTHPDGLWWVQFQIDIGHPLAWHAVQELACVANYLSIEERLPTIFYPVSPAPYLNGGPQEFLSWILETRDSAFKPGTLMKWLEERLPQPVEDEEAWQTEEE